MIAINGLQKVRDQTTVLDIPKLQVAEGEIVGVIGLPGSGLADLFELLIGKARPSLGSILLAGVNPLTDRTAFGYQVGVLFAEGGVYPGRTTRQNLDFYLQLRGLDRAKIPNYLAQIGLADQANVKASELSSGLLRRLAFGCATLHQPAVLLLNEPFHQCDQASVELLSDLIRAHAARGAAVLILSSERTQLNRLCEAIHTLDKGEVVETFDPAEEVELALPFKIPVRLEGRVVLVNPGDILYAEAVEGRVDLHTTEGQLPAQYTLNELEARLVRSGFFRAHRSYLVNLQHIKEVIPYTRSTYSLLLDNPQKTEIPLSRSAIGELKDLLGF